MTPTTERVTHQMLADSYDVWRAASLDIVHLSLRALAEGAREEFPSAARLVFEWSDQGDFLDLDEIQGANGEDLDEDGVFDTSTYDWNLGSDCAGQWGQYMTAEDGTKVSEMRERDRNRGKFYLDVDTALAIEIPEKFRG